MNGFGEIIMDALKAPEGIFPLLRFRPNSILAKGQIAAQCLKTAMLKVKYVLLFFN